MSQENVDMEGPLTPRLIARWADRLPRRNPERSYRSSIGNEGGPTSRASSLAMR